MRVTCPKCDLKGLVDTGPLMLKTRVVCVRCATSYEAVLVDGALETFLPSSNGHSQASQGVDWNLLETGPMPDEPLELPGPIFMKEASAQIEHVLEDISSATLFKQDESLPEKNFALAQLESTESESKEEESTVAEILSPLEEDSSLSSFASEETAWPDEETAAPDEENALIPQEASTAWLSEEDKAWPLEKPVVEEHVEAQESLSDEETVPPSEIEVSQLSEAEFSSESEAEVSPLSLVSSSASSTSFEAEILPASETETEPHDSLLDTSQAPHSAVVMEEQPVGFVHTAKDALPYPDRHSLGVRLMRVSPVWLLGSGLLFISLIFAFNWATKPDAQANNLTFNHSLTGRASNTAAQPIASNAPVQAAVETNVGADQKSSLNANAASAVSPASPVNDAALANAAPNASPVTVNPPQIVKDAPIVNTSHAVETKSAPEVNQSQSDDKQSDDKGSGNFTVQVGSYSDRTQALERVAVLKSVGFDARLVEVQLPKRGTWYRVQAGRFGTREEATRYGQQLRAQKVAAESIITEIQDQ